MDANRKHSIKTIEYPMKPNFLSYFLLSAFILPLNAQTFPQPELWLRDTAAQVINPTMEQVMEFRDKTEQQIWGNMGDMPLQ